jgi:hypothetical protein
VDNNNGKSPNLLQQAVKPLDDSQRARVLEFALKCQIDPADPFWVQYIILAELQVSEWRNLLLEFRDEMQLLAQTNEQWNDTNLELMHSLVKKAQIEELRVAVESLKQLNHILNRTHQSAKEFEREVSGLVLGTSTLNPANERTQAVERSPSGHTPKIEPEVGR